MAILQISQIQVRRGLQQDLPQLASGEFGWSVDTRKLFIGNGTLDEGSPLEGQTEILTSESDLLNLNNLYTFKGLSAGTQVVTGVDPLHPIYRTLQDKIDDYVSVKDFGAVGNGFTDDTAAIQRALDRAYSTAHSVSLTDYHRTIVFPAGTYRISSTINIPPYSRIQGEGKRTTIITGDFNGPLAQFSDQYGQTGVLFGQPDSGVDPEYFEYHFSDIAFTHQTIGKSCLVIDGGWTATFNRVMFRGVTTGVRAEFGTLIDCDGTIGQFTLSTTDTAAAGLTPGMAIGGWGESSAYMGVGGTVQSVAETPPLSGTYVITTDVANVGTFSGIPTNFVDMSITTNPTYDNNRGSGVAAVDVNNRSIYVGVRNLIFNQCDFLDHNYGIEINNEVIGVTLTSCYFDRLFHALLAGNNSAGYDPYGFSIFDNYFRYSAREAVRGELLVNNIMSESNIYSAAGLGDWQASYPITNPDLTAICPAVTFNDNNNFSIADSFDRDATDYALFPNIETNGYDCYLVAQDRGVVNGKLTNGTGYTTTLAISATFTTAGLIYIPIAGYSNLTINYTMNNTTNQRTGTFRVTKVGSTYVVDDEYSETGNVGVVLNVNTSTGDIEYTATSETILTYNLNFFS